MRIAQVVGARHNHGVLPARAASAIGTATVAVAVAVAVAVVVAAVVAVAAVVVVAAVVAVPFVPVSLPTTLWRSNVLVLTRRFTVPQQTHPFVVPLWVCHQGLAATRPRLTHAHVAAAMLLGHPAVVVLRQWWIPMRPWQYSKPSWTLSNRTKRGVHGLRLRKA